jgi:DNA-binding protein HU-beta
MNKTEFVKAVAEKSGKTIAEAEEFVNAYSDVVKESLVSGDKVQITGFGIYEVNERSARTGRNPKTGEEMQIPASKGVKFKAGKILKEAVNGSNTED